MKVYLSPLRNLIVYLAIACSFSKATAEENSVPSLNPGVELSGYFDFYYQASPQGHSSGNSTGPEVVDGRYFDRHINQMTLNMAEISLKKKSNRVSFRADVAIGEMVDQLSGGGSQSVTGTGVGQNPTNTAANEPTRNLTQATLTYSLTDRFSLTAGKFYTHMGFEVTKAKDNWQYSRSYTFNYGIPFWHEGVSGTYSVVPDKLSTTIYLLNAWDGRNSQELNQSTTAGVNLNFTGMDSLIANYNYLGGSESTDKSKREVHELNLVYTVSSALSVAGDYISGIQKNIPSSNDSKWSGLSLYLKMAVSSKYTISPRYEMFDDSDSGFAVAGGLSASGIKQKISSWTLANNFDLGDGLEARIELRSDKSDSDLYFKDSAGATSDKQESVLVGLLYAL